MQFLFLFFLIQKAEIGLFFIFVVFVGKSPKPKQSTVSATWSRVSRAETMKILLSGFFDTAKNGNIKYCVVEKLFERLSDTVVSTKAWFSVREVRSFSRDSCLVHECKLIESLVTLNK